MNVKEVTAVLALVSLPVLGWWAVSDRLVSAQDLQQEQALRVGEDYRIRYRYDKLDINRQMQDAERRLAGIANREITNVSWQGDEVRKAELERKILDLQQQARDLDTWARSIK